MGVIWPNKGDQRDELRGADPKFQTTYITAWG